MQYRRMFLLPAEYVFKVFGNASVVARAIGRHPSAVGRWAKPRDRRGCGGYVPNAAQRLILQIANERNLDITPRDLIFGREIGD